MIGFTCFDWNVVEFAKHILIDGVLVGVCK